MSGSRRVVVTGAAGAIGRAVAPRLPADWETVLTDRTAGHGVDGVLDVVDPRACELAFEGADAVIHLAADPDPRASWAALAAPNVVGVHNVAAAAAFCGVRRLVLASSLQAVSAYPPEYQRRGGDPARPANLYGATKAWAEAVGSWVAATSATSVVALRIGYFAEVPPSGADGTPRNLGAWLSPRDCADLLRAAVEAGGVTYLVANGISANRHRSADIGETVDRLGYRPVDDAWTAGAP